MGVCGAAAGWPGLRSSASVWYATSASELQMELSASSRDLVASVGSGEDGAEDERVEGDFGELGWNAIPASAAATVCADRLGRPKSTSSARERGADCSTEPMTRYEDTEMSFVIEPTRPSSIDV